jgi:HK97 gp10 family phage protein
MKVKFSVEGLKQLDEALGQLPRATGKNVLRRVGRKALAPVVDQAKAFVVRGTRDVKTKVGIRKAGSLLKSIKISSRLSKRQAAAHRKMFKDERASIELFAGPGALPHAHLNEFGGGNNRARPFLRPAWDGNVAKVLATIRADLGHEIMKAAKRLARRAAKAKG